MALIPKKFLKSSDAAVTFSYTDFAAGTGFVIYSGGQTETSAAETYNLTENPFYSNATAVTALDNGVAFSKLIDLDFDVLFELPQDLRGNAIVSATLGFHGAVGAKDYDAYYIARVKKADVEIASAQSETYTETNLGVGVTKSRTKTVPIVIPLTHFKKGETLRLTMEVWGKQSAATNGTFGIGCDPLDRNDETVSTPVIEDADTTQLLFHAPFRINKV